MIDHPGRTPSSILAGARRWALLGVMMVGSAVPWYALRVFPVVTKGSATINLLDILVGCAVLLSLPAIGKTLRTRDPAILAPVLFLAYMAVPFMLGPLRDSGAWSYAVRESRALAFYALALAFAAGGYSRRDYQQFAIAYASGAVVGIAAVFVHLLWRVPLPGYPTMIASTPEPQAGIIARYLEWTVPVVLFLFCVAGVLVRASPWRRAGWAAGLCCAVWYLIAMHERTPEAVALAVAILLLCLPPLGGLTWRRLAVTAAGLALVAGIGLGAIPAPRWVRVPADHMLRYWSQVSAGDASIHIRLGEIRSALPTLFRHPILGGGLGSVVAPSPPDFPGGPWRYIAPGYGYLLLKTGIVGLVLYLAMVGIALRRGWEMIRAGREAGGWPQWSIASAGMAALLAMNLTHAVVDIPEGAIAFSLFFGMLVTPGPAAAQKAGARTASKDLPRRRRAAGSRATEDGIVSVESHTANDRP